MVFSKGHIMHYLVGKNRKQMRRYLPDKKRLVLLGKLACEEVLDGGCHDLQNPYLKNAIGFDRLKPKEILLNYIKDLLLIIHALFKKTRGANAK